MNADASRLVGPGTPGPPPPLALDELWRAVLVFAREIGLRARGIPFEGPFAALCPLLPPALGDGRCGHSLLEILGSGRVHAGDARPIADDHARRVAGQALLVAFEPAIAGKLARPERRFYMARSTALLAGLVGSCERSLTDEALRGRATRILREMRASLAPGEDQPLRGLELELFACVRLLGPGATEGFRFAPLSPWSPVR